MTMGATMVKLSPGLNVGPGCHAGNLVMAITGPAHGDDQGRNEGE